MFVTVNRRIQGKAQMKDGDPLLAYLPSEDEPFDWLVGMFRFFAQLSDNRSLLEARAKSSDEAGLAKLATRLLNDARVCDIRRRNDEEPPRQSSKRKTSSDASHTKPVKRPQLVRELGRRGCEGSDKHLFICKLLGVCCWL
jgi:hypothetical protein